MSALHSKQSKSIMSTLKIALPFACWNLGDLALKMAKIRRKSGVKILDRW